MRVAVAHLISHFRVPDTSPLLFPYYNCKNAIFSSFHSSIFFYFSLLLAIMSAMEEPKPKKAKTAVKEEEEEEHDKEGEEEQDEDGKKDQVKMQQNENGESFCELSRTRRLTVRKFKSAILVDIREVRSLKVVCRKKQWPNY